MSPLSFLRRQRPSVDRNPISPRPATTKLLIEPLEDRLLLDAGLLTGIGAIGDSYTAERGGNNWTEQLAVVRDINFGPAQSVSVGGVSFLDYEYVRSGTPQTMAGNGALAALAARVADGSVTLAYLDGVGNDFAQVYAAIYQGTLAGPQLQAFIDAEVADLEAAIDTLLAAGDVKLVLENVGDFGGTPFVVHNVFNFLSLPAGQSPDPARKQLFTNAIQAANVLIQDLADEYGIPVVDQFGWGSRVFSTSQPPVVGGFTLDVSPTFTQVTSLSVTDPLRLFIDSQHVGPVAQGLKANIFLDAIQQAYGVGVARLSDQEILAYAYARAGLPAPPAGPATYFDVSGLVGFKPPTVQTEGKPGPINLASNGVISVTLRGSSTFDVTQVDVNSILFAGAHVVHSSRQDVNGDGRADLVLHFRTQDTNLLAVYRALLVSADAAGGNAVAGALDPGTATRQTATVSLTGKTTSGQLFEGSDSLELFLAGNNLRDLLDELADGGFI